MAENLPVREIVLYKHGVGFFVRQGAVSGPSTSLVFQQDEINDVLKSLAVLDRAGGLVLGIHYQTPMDSEARLRSSSIRLSDTASLRDLLRDLRGRRVALTVDDERNGGSKDVIGRIVGPDLNGQASDVPIQPVELTDQGLVIIQCEDDGQNQGSVVCIFRLRALRAVRILDTLADHDLTYFLDTSRGDDARRTVMVRLSEGEHDLVISYVTPSPTWRVSYRLVAQTDPDGGSGIGQLQGWGLFDNRLDEDLEDVRVTLVAGQPISFIYNLYDSRIPDRPTVQDEARIAPGPIEYEGAVMAKAASSPVAAPAQFEAYEAFDTPDMLYSLVAPEEDTRERGVTTGGRASFGEIASRFRQNLAQAKDTGEVFQYEVTAPVSVRRGQSALVPILGNDLTYNRELLYNRQKLPNHPVAALRFMNTTGLTLERGPITVVEDGDYKGEAIVPFTKDKAEVYLPFAVELGVKITESQEYETVQAALSIEQGYLLIDEYQIETTRYTLENTTLKPVTVTVEAPLVAQREVFDTPPADVETATNRRWRVSCPAQAKVEFTRKERWPTRRREELRRMHYRRLQELMTQQRLDRKVMDRLSEMFEQMALVQRLRAERDQLATETNSLYEKQEQLRANLGALNAAGQEAAFRNRILQQLEQSQDRLEQIEQRQDSIKQQTADAEQRIEAIIAALG